MPNLAGFTPDLTGTADSWVDLHPLEWNESSEAFATDGVQQVGLTVNGAPIGPPFGAASPESHVDLHAFLPQKYEWSWASGICTMPQIRMWSVMPTTVGASVWKRLCGAPTFPRRPTHPPAKSPSTDLSRHDGRGDHGAVDITGSDFQLGCTVTLENGAGPTPSVEVINVSVDGFTIGALITASGGGPHGVRVWDVRVTNPDDSTGTLPDGFTVIR